MGDISPKRPASHESRQPDPRRSSTPIPDIRSKRCPSDRRPIDLVHLSAQTGGDRQLEREVLTLLKAQLDGAAARLSAADRETRGILAHALKGAALNMGAFALAHAAEGLEATPDDQACLDDLVAVVAVTGAMIDHLLA